MAETGETSKKRLRLRDYRVRWWGWIPTLAPAVVFIGDDFGVASVVALMVLVALVLWLPASFLFYAVVRRTVLAATLALAVTPLLAVATIYAYGKHREAQSLQQHEAEEAEYRAQRAEWLEDRDRHLAEMEQLSAAARKVSYFSAEEVARQRHLIAAWDLRYTSQTPVMHWQIASIKAEVVVLEEEWPLMSFANARLDASGAPDVRVGSRDELLDLAEEAAWAAESARGLREVLDRSHVVYAVEMEHPRLEAYGVAALEHHARYVEESKAALGDMGSAFDRLAGVYRRLASWWDYWEYCPDCNGLHFDEAITPEEQAAHNEEVVSLRAGTMEAIEEFFQAAQEWSDWSVDNGPPRMRTPDEP